MADKDIKTVGGINYRIGRMNAMTQFHVARRVGPALVKAIGPLTELQEVARIKGGMGRLTEVADNLGLITVLVEALSRINNEDCEFVIYTCLRVAERDIGGGKGWVRMVPPDQNTFQYNDLDMIGMLTLTSYVIQENILNFFFGTDSEIVAP